VKFLIGVVVGIVIGRQTIDLTPNSRAMLTEAIDAVASRLNEYSDKLSKENKK